jgi:hypothetical protein
VTDRALSSPKRCIFCGAHGPLTLEHPVDQWLRESLGAGPFSAFRGTTKDTPGELTTIAEWTDHDLPKARVACGPCNNVWMRDLGVAAQPMLERMARGQSKVLTADEQLSLSAWAVKVAIVSAYIVSLGDIVEWRRRRFWDTHLPPPQTEVWAAAYSGSSLGVFATVHQSKHSYPGEADVIGHVTTVTVFQLVLQVVEVPFTGLTVNRGPAQEPYAVRLHPVRESS